MVILCEPHSIADESREATQEYTMATAPKAEPIPICAECAEIFRPWAGTLTRAGPTKQSVTITITTLDESTRWPDGIRHSEWVDNTSGNFEMVIRKPK